MTTGLVDHACCAYDADEHLRATANACVHPRLDSPAELTPSQLFARGGELVLAGELDAQAAPLLAEVLSLVEVPAHERVVLDASGLTFIDHRALLTVVEHLRRHRSGAITLVGAPASACRLRDLLGVAGDELVLELRP
jgi:anti-anti-sigma regulatory factor